MPLEEFACMADTSYEQDTRTYVLKIWREEDEKPEKYGLWRGYITEVISRKKVHVQNIADVTKYLQEQLQELGVPIKKQRSLFRRLFSRD